jgi:hypothetical protein
MSDQTAQDSSAATPAHGIPDGACDAEPKGLPTSDRHHTETSAAERGGNADAEKHRHTA